MAKPMKTLALHCPMIHFLLNNQLDNFLDPMFDFLLKKCSGLTAKHRLAALTLDSIHLSLTDLIVGKNVRSWSIFLLCNYNASNQRSSIYNLYTSLIPLVCQGKPLSSLEQTGNDTRKRYIYPRQLSKLVSLAFFPWETLNFLFSNLTYLTELITFCFLSLRNPEFLI